MSDKPRIGIVGTGWWATQHHIPSLLGYDGAELAALADPNPEALARAATQAGIDQTFTDVSDLYASGLVDAVVIAVPHVYHYELVRSALDAGLHVLVEKPMTLRSDHAYELVRTARDRGRHLMVGYVYQYTRAVQRLRAAVRAGALGDLLLVSALYSSMVEEYYRGRPESYRDVFAFPVTGPGASTYSDPEIAGGGQGQTQVTHVMGLISYVTGQRVASVSAAMHNAGLAVDLVDAMSFTFADGAVGTIASTGSITADQVGQQEFRYYGTGGFAVHDLLRGTLVVQRNDGDVERLDPSEAGDPFPAGAPARALADVIAGRAESRSPAEPAADTVAFLEAAYASARQGGAQVRLAEPTADDQR